jgi:Ca2+-binding RTX toxin-like protein
MAAVTAFSSLTAVLVFASTASAATTSRLDHHHGRVLTIRGDGRADSISVGRDAAGVIEVNGSAVRIHGAPATVGNVDRIVVLGGRGSDRLAVDDSSGPLPSARLYGGSGDDELFGGSRADRLFGGGGDDLLAGGGGNDQSFGGAGTDQLIWNPGDGSDVNEGGDGSDSVVVNGGLAAESFTATADGTRVRFERVTPAAFSLDIGTTEHLVVNANGGDDSFAASGDLASLISLTVDGGPGNDRISGGNGNDVLSGGVGDDTVDGNAGADSAVLDDGTDTFVWDAGDGSDTVEGQAGEDTLVFNGSPAAEQMTLSAKGPRAQLVRDVGHVSMDLNGIERVETRAFAGTDTITVDDLSGTDVTEADLDLAGAPKAAGDGADDQLVVNATDGADAAKIAGDDQGAVTVSGLHALVRVFGAEPSDALTFNALGGDDTVDATGLQAGVVGLTVTGGAGTDTLSGGPGAVLIP